MAAGQQRRDDDGQRERRAFPPNPDDPTADGVRNLADTRARARDTRRPVTMPIQEYDIPLPDGTWG